jgi:hypothetical protein
MGSRVRVVKAIRGGVVAALTTACLGGCRAVQLRYSHAVDPRPGHPVQVHLGLAPGGFWLPRGAVGPVAVAVDDTQLALLWPGRRNRTALLYRQVDRSGPCGPPTPASMVEGGRESIAVDCQPGIDSVAGWRSATFKVAGETSLRATFSDGDLWVAAATRKSIEVLDFRLPRLVLKRRLVVRVRGVAALQIQSLDRHSLILAALRTSNAKDELRLFRVGGRQIDDLRAMVVDKASPLALAQFGRGFVVAVNRDEHLTVYRSTEGRSDLRAAKQFRRAARAIVLGQQHGSGLPLAVVWGPPSDNAGRVIAGYLRVRLASFRASRTSASGVPLVVVGGADHPPFIVVEPSILPLVASAAARPTTVYFTKLVRWNAESEHYVAAPLVQMEEPAVDLVASSAQNAVGVFGGLESGGHPLHVAYFLDP